MTAALVIFMHATAIICTALVARLEWLAVRANGGGHVTTWPAALRHSDQRCRY